jgi:hypothetical protein
VAQVEEESAVLRLNVAEEADRIGADLDDTLARRLDRERRGGDDFGSGGDGGRQARIRRTPG